MHEDSHGLADIYKVAVDWAHQYSEDDVDDFFRRAAFRTPPKVACEMRCIRLEYGIFVLHFSFLIVQSIAVLHKLITWGDI